LHVLGSPLDSLLGFSKRCAFFVKYQKNYSNTRT
jgi:hypothetical protein